MVTIPPEIGNLSNLKTLHLNATPLETLPPEIGNLSNLNYLNLEHSYFLRSLPSEIGNLSNLKKLNLSSTNNLEKIPPTIMNLDLDSFQLGRPPGWRGGPAWRDTIMENFYLSIEELKQFLSLRRPKNDKIIREILKYSKGIKSSSPLRRK